MMRDSSIVSERVLAEVLANRVVNTRQRRTHFRQVPAQVPTSSSMSIARDAFLNTHSGLFLDKFRQVPHMHRTTIGQL